MISKLETKPKQIPPPTNEKIEKGWKKFSDELIQHILNPNSEISKRARWIYNQETTQL